MKRLSRRKWEASIIAGSIIAVLVSGLVGIGWTLSIIIGFFITIIGLIAKLSFFVESNRQETLDTVGKGFECFGNIVQCLLKLQSREGSFLTRNKKLILGSIEEENEIKKISDNMKLWRDRILAENQSEDCEDLWRIVFNIYMSEENKDLGDKRIATNIEIYTHLLLSFIKYFIEKYKDDAVVFIITSLLPSEWYERKKWIPRDFTYVENYRKAIEEYIKAKKNEKINVENYNRYIVVQENSTEGIFHSFDELKEDRLRKDKKYVDEYPDKLHFAPAQAKYFKKKIFGKYFSDEYKDILIFGVKEGDQKSWRWAIQSTMTPSFPVMFINFYDSSDLDVSVFASSNAAIFTDTIKNNAKCLTELQKEVS